MDQQPLAIVREIYDLYLGQQKRSVLEMLHPDVTLNVAGRRSDHPAFGDWFGRQGAADFFRAIEESVDFTAFEPQAYYAVGDKVFVTGHYSMVFRDTGRTAASDWVHIFTVKDGLVTDYREFLDTAQMARAPGPVVTTFQ